MLSAKRTGLIGGVHVALLAGVCFYAYGRPYWVPVVYKLTGKRMVSDILAIYGASARTRLRLFFDAQGLPYPPERVFLLASKEEATLELWSVGGDSTQHIRTYPIQALSGNRGPKLREGDRQLRRTTLG